MDRLVGRDDLLARLRRAVADQQSVLLVGPAAVGKSALIRTVARDTAIEIIDPFEAIASRHAAQIRRRLDRGVSIVGATQTLDRRRLGAVGRIWWRFEIVRVRPLSHAEISALIASRLGADALIANGARAWVRELARAASGLPGRGCAFADAGLSHWRRRGCLPTREWTIVEALASELSKILSPTPRTAR